MDWKEGVTFGVALLGAVLGVINTVWALYRDRVRLRVAAIWMSNIMPIAGSQQMVGVTTESESGFRRNPNGRLGVRVTNLGFVEVTVDNVGLTRSGFFHRIRNHRVQRSPIIQDALGVVQLPYRMRPRESITVWSDADDASLQRVMRQTKRVFASTSCGVNVFGSSGLLRALVAQANANG